MIRRIKGTINSNPPLLIIFVIYAAFGLITRFYSPWEVEWYDVCAELKKYHLTESLAYSFFYYGVSDFMSGWAYIYELLSAGNTSGEIFFVYATIFLIQKVIADKILNHYHFSGRIVSFLAGMMVSNIVFTIASFTMYMISPLFTVENFSQTNILVMIVSIVTIALTFPVDMYFITLIMGYFLFTRISAWEYDLGLSSIIQSILILLTAGTTACLTQKAADWVEKKILEWMSYSFIARIPGISNVFEFLFGD